MKCIETTYSPHYITKVPNAKAAALVAAGTARYVNKQDYKATKRGRELLRIGRQCGKTTMTMACVEETFAAISAAGKAMYAQSPFYGKPVTDPGINKALQALPIEQ